MTDREVALIGAGMIAKTHVAALSKLQSRNRLSTIISTRPERAEYLADYYQGPAPLFSSNLSDVLDNRAIKAVIVATPPNVRMDLIQALANTGKHVLLEKPVARNLAEAEQVVKLCQDAGITLGVLFQHRMQDSAIAAKKWITNGELGTIGLVEITAPLWRPQSYYEELDRGTYDRDGGGVLITQAIHTIDLALSFTSPVTRVQAMTATTKLHQMQAEDYAVAGLHFACGAIGSLTASTATYPHGKEKILLHGEFGSLHLGRETFELFWRDGRTMPNQHSADAGRAVTDKSEWHKRVIEDFLDCIECNAEPMVTGEEALSAHRLIDAIERSSHTGSAITIAPQA